jgi:hypothetical protein
VLRAGSTDQDCVAMLVTHQAMVRDPAQGDFSHCQLMSFGGCIDGSHCFEVMLVPIALTIVLWDPNKSNDHSMRTIVKKDYLSLNFLWIKS